MIWFDNHRSFASANYYVQKLFMNNQGTRLLRLEKDGFDKKTPIGSPAIFGAIELEAENEVKAEFSDICIIADGEEKRYEDIFADSEKVYLDTVDSENYTIKLKAKKISGPRGFRIKFGKADDKNFIDWTLGGWANGDCQIETNINGRTSGIKHKVFSVMTGITYDLKLEVNGRDIAIYIDGEKQFEVTDKQTVIEELYLTSSIDEDTDEIILKAVNAQDKPTSAIINIDGFDNVRGTIFELSGHALDAENSFENPKNVYPSEREFNSEANFEYTFKPYSVTVFRLSK